MTTTLIDIVIDVKKARTLSEKQWETIIIDAREQSMLGRLYWLLKSSGVIENVPPRAVNHLASAFQIASQQRISVNRELDEISAAFADKPFFPLLLKGAAYSFLDLAACNGRSFNDLDLLVYRKNLQAAEIALMVKGWVHKKEDEYNKEYYRKWMHEIQPMIHIKRFTVIDLHHSLLPLTNKSHFDAAKLNWVKAPTLNLATLDPLDLFIHSAVHLFTEGEFSHPLRDLTDLSMLYDEIEHETPSELIAARAQALGVLHYIDLAILYSAPFCKKATDTSPSLKRLKCSLIYRWLVLPAFSKLFTSSSVSNPDITYKISCLILYWRGHLHRMPLTLLVPHLIKKARMKGDKKKTFGKDWN